MKKGEHFPRVLLPWVLGGKHSLVANGLDSALGYFCRWLAGWIWASSLPSVALHSSSTDWGQQHEKLVWSSKQAACLVVSDALQAHCECSLCYGWEHSVVLSFLVSSWDRGERQGENTPSFLNLPYSWINWTWTKSHKAISEHWQWLYGGLCKGEINAHRIYLPVELPLILPLNWPSDLWLQVAGHLTETTTKECCPQNLSVEWSWPGAVHTPSFSFCSPAWGIPA